MNETIHMPRGAEQSAAAPGRARHLTCPSEPRDIGLCGYVRQPGEPAAPPSRPLCVVCEDIAAGRCPTCGGRHPLPGGGGDAPRRRSSAPVIGDSRERWERWFQGPVTMERAERALVLTRRTGKPHIYTDHGRVDVVGFDIYRFGLYRMARQWVGNWPPDLLAGGKAT
jgi:hypothetical protein